MDPPRDNVPEAIAKCHNAGVKVFMVTGDHPLTARSIAKEIGLLKGDNNIELLEHETAQKDWETCDGAVVHGCRVDELTDDQWRTILSKEGGVCFARTTPAHKLIIVEKCQTLLGSIVAVTGDGVNDAPALKQADIGIAMGLKGSAVAQDAADILLMDDNFASIVNGIEEGRIIFDNIKKTIAYTMAHIFPEVVSALLSIVIGLPAGLTAMQVLTIDLGTEMGPAISLAYEKPEANIMDRMPRNPLKDRLVSPVLLFYSYFTSGLVITGFCILSYMLTYRDNDIQLADFYKPELDSADAGAFSLSPPDDPVTVERTGQTYSVDDQKRIFSEGTTAFYITLVFAQFCHIWAVKTRLSSLFTHGLSNRSTFYGVFIGLCLTVFFCYVPGVQNFVGSAQVGYIPWVMGLLAGITLFVYNEASKWYFRHAGPENKLVQLLSW
jgi:sodium/potassium-transporting ATPase subunit alpha